MQYLMSVHHNVTEDDQFGPYASQQEMEQALADTDRFNQRLQADGHWVFAGGLEPATRAQVVDARQGDASTRPGPHLSTPEHLGGVWVVEAADEATALRLAADASRACRAAVEVRAFHQL